MSDPFDYDVFLSYNRQDKPRVRTLAEQMKKNGLLIWLNKLVSSHTARSCCHDKKKSALCRRLSRWPTAIRLH